jgi:cell division protein ZapE
MPAAPALRGIDLGMVGTIGERHRALLATGEIERDPGQESVVAKLAALEARLERHRLAQKSSSLGWLFGRGAASRGPVEGLYLHGEVGRGKTMLMDLFFASAAIARKRRAHFHEFMLDVHARIHAWRRQRKRGEVKGEDPIPPVAAALAEQAYLLCFDELNVTDIADAMILGRLFAELFEHGVIVVATSNVPPDELYREGLNRALFLPFVALIVTHMEIVRLDARTDFRLEKLASAPVWHVPADAAADAALAATWRQLTGSDTAGPQEFAVKGRILRVPRAAMGAAWLSFPELCGRALGAADYLKLAHEFHTILLGGIPVMDYARRNEAKRFIVLIDTLYDRAVKLVASAQAEPEALYSAGTGFEAQEFARTASRLIEMRSRSYLALPHGRRRSETEGIVET